MQPELQNQRPSAPAVASPPAFPVLFALVCFHAIISFAYFHASAPLFFVAAIIVSVAIVYCFWRGQSWARIVVILTAITDFLLDVPRFSHAPPVMRLILALRLLSAAVLLIWLSTPSVRAYFRRNHLTRRSSQSLTGE
jgi:uncharacterized membrane protein